MKTVAFAARTVRKDLVAACCSACWRPEAVFNSSRMRSYWMMEAPAAMDEGGAKLRRLTRLLQAATRNGESLRGARNGKAVEQLLPVLEKWTDDVLKTPTDRDRVEAARAAMTVLGALAIDRAYVERVIVAKTKRGVPAEVRLAAIRSLGREANGWVVPQLEELLKDALRDADEYQQLTWPIATALADIGDPAAIPTMIAAIDADNTYQTVYGIGWFGLNRLTGVDYDESHNGQWWRDWWQKNRNRYPEAVRTLEIPALTKTDLKATAAAEQDPTADVRDVANEPITIGGDPKQQYFLIGADQAAKQAAAKGDGLKLLLVLPGGDGSAGFNPFVRRIRKFGLSDGWAIAELVAPKWDETRSKQVVWPTEKNRFAAAKFTTEEFIDAVIKDVRARVRIDARNIYLMGWSSGGPAVYAAMLRKDTSIAGAYVLMSVFPEEFKPVIEHAKGKRFYLFQSPNDQVTPIEHARRAREALEKAGATVMLNTYDGGHGFNFPVWEEIPKAVEWLTGR